jgi:hypothetical protein
MSYAVVTWSFRKYAKVPELAGQFQSRRSLNITTLLFSALPIAGFGLVILDLQLVGH